MENKFYPDDFEQFLKETADNFRMYPSKRVWNSLYNNLHPGRKWPSLAVCLLMITSFIYVGISHKNEISGSETIAKKAFHAPLIALQNLPTAGPQSPLLSSNNSSQQSSQTGNRNNIPGLSSSGKHNPEIDQEPITNTNNNNQDNNGNHTNKNLIAGKSHINTFNEIPAELIIENIAKVPNDETAKDAVEIKITSAEVLVNTKPNATSASIPEKNKNTTVKKTLQTVNNNKGITDKEWIEDYAFHHKPSPGRKARLSYQFYITPSFGYRNITNTIDYEIPAITSLIATANNPDVHNSLNQTPALNLELGSNLLYSISKTMRLKAGLQLNYTNYKIRAYELGHTTLTTLLLATPGTGSTTLVPRASSLANLPGETSDKKLNSNTYQVSLPIGADLKIAGKNNLKLFVGATVQPTFVVGGNGYLISSDLKNYIYDASFIRKVNVNASIETFLSYRLKNGTYLNAGPQFRYQFLSTYNNKYTYDEKLYNIGLKIGAIRNF